ncbi:MAG: serine/threonine-protein kinase [Planctomycetota bacterium]
MPPPDNPPRQDRSDAEGETLMSISGHAGPVFSQQDDLAPGAAVGKYSVRLLLGRGGMGAVYEALDTALQRHVALKVLPSAFTQNRQALQRFIREAQLAAKLNHPNVVTVYDVGDDHGTYFIAMELVRGKSADDLIRSGVKLHHTQATRMTAYACKALSVAHAQGLIHRDIKPANLLVAHDKTVKLADFGLAKLHAAADHTLTSKDVVLGTPKYMSPEQCQNEPIDARSDIYSLGATYFALLTGKAPYDDGSTMQILFAHCSKPVPDPRELAPHVPEACVAVVQKAMAKNPADRYASADAMFADLKAALSQGATQASLAATVPTAPVSADEPDPLGNVFAALDASAPTQPATPVDPSAPTYAVDPTALAAAQQRKTNTLIVGIAAAAVLLLAAVVGVALLVIASGRVTTPAPPALAAAPMDQHASPAPAAASATPAETIVTEPTPPTDPTPQPTPAAVEPPRLPEPPPLPPINITVEQSADAADPASQTDAPAASPPRPPDPPIDDEPSSDTNDADRSAEVAAIVASARAEFDQLKTRLTDAIDDRDPNQVRGAVLALRRFQERYSGSSVNALAVLSERARQLLEANKPRSIRPPEKPTDRPTERNRPTPPQRR